MTEEANVPTPQLKRVPLIAVHDDIPHIIGEALIDETALRNKAKVELTGQLTEVVATVFRSDGNV